MPPELLAELAELLVELRRISELLQLTAELQTLAEPAKAVTTNA